MRYITILFVLLATLANAQSGKIYGKQEFQNKVIFKDTTSYTILKNDVRGSKVLTTDTAGNLIAVTGGGKATNGLSKQNDTTILGGTLSRTTSIDTKSYPYGIGQLNNSKGQKYALINNHDYIPVGGIGYNGHFFDIPNGLFYVGGQYGTGRGTTFEVNDSLGIYRFSKLKNNIAGDSVAAFDTSGRLIQKYISSGGGGPYLPLAGGTMDSGASILFGTGGQNISQGSFDNGLGGNNGISLNCAVGYELNWQAQHLSCRSGGGYQPILIDSKVGIGNSSPQGMLHITSASGKHQNIINGDIFGLPVTWGITDQDLYLVYYDTLGNYQGHLANETHNVGTETNYYTPLFLVSGTGGSRILLSDIDPAYSRIVNRSKGVYIGDDENSWNATKLIVDDNNKSITSEVDSLFYISTNNIFRVNANRTLINNYVGIGTFSNPSDVVNALQVGTGTAINPYEIRLGDLGDPRLILGVDGGPYFQFKDDHQAVGKVFTSDANGYGSWQTLNFFRHTMANLEQSYVGVDSNADGRGVNGFVASYDWTDAPTGLGYHTFDALGDATEFGLDKGNYKVTYNDDFSSYDVESVGAGRFIGSGRTVAYKRMLHAGPALAEIFLDSLETFFSHKDNGVEHCMFMQSYRSGWQTIRDDTSVYKNARFWLPDENKVGSLYNDGSGILEFEKSPLTKIDTFLFSLTNDSVILTYTVGDENAMYQVGGYLNVKASTGATVEYKIAYIDEEGNNSNFKWVSTIGHVLIPNVNIYCKNGTDITISTTVSGGTATWNAGATIIKP